MALQGKLQLDFARNGKVVNRVTKKNTYTGYADDLMCEGNYGMFIPRDKLLPVKQFFEGCILTDHVNDASGNMIHHNSNITACAGSDTDFSGLNPKRGRFSALESGVISSPNDYKGYRFVWNWDTAYGNGSIASVCLTRSKLAIAEYTNTSTIPDAGVEINEVMYDGGGLGSTFKYLGGMHIIDYEREVGYKIRYASNTITIEEYQLSCKNLHLLTRPALSSTSDAYHPEYVGTHTIAQTVANYTDYTSSYSYTGDKIYIITWSGSTINAYPIDISDWTIDPDDIVTKTFGSVTFMENYNTQSNPYGHKDIVLLDGNYAWCMATVGGVGKMIKIDLLGTSPAVVEKTLPISVSNRNNGCCVKMPNGDFYKFASTGIIIDGNNKRPCLYYHNGEFYLAKDVFPNKADYGNVLGSVNGNLYGTALFCAYGHYFDTGTFAIHSLHGFVSTIANLDTVETKRPDLTMKLTYEITEVNPS